MERSEPYNYRNNCAQFMVWYKNKIKFPTQMK